MKFGKPEGGPPGLEFSLERRRATFAAKTTRSRALPLQSQTYERSEPAVQFSGNMMHQIQTGKRPAIDLVFCLLTASAGRGDQRPGAGLRTIDLPDGFVAKLAAPAAPGDEAPYVSPFFMLSGALLTDSFDGPQLDATLWSRPPWLVDNHKTIGVKIENGHLVISGPSHPAGGSHQYAGVISKYFRDTDAVLAAEMQAQSPFNG